MSGNATRAAVAGGPDSGRESELARVLEGYLADLEAGRAAAPERLLAEHPAIAEQLRHCLGGLRLVKQAAEALSGPAPAADGEGSRPRPILAGLAEESEAGRLGDFRLVRELGRGGMGVVYEAEQVSLGRRVALKVLPFAAAIDARQLRRFQLEAQAAATLHHRHIVPVHGVGCERGVHYYAMQLIEGRTVADLVAELRRIDGLDAPGPERGCTRIDPATGLPTSAETGPPAPAGTDAPTVELTSHDTGPAAAPPPSGSPAKGSSSPSSGSSVRNRAYLHTVARLGRQAAEALEHAHQQGVLHRDVKPSNLMVDGRGELWVTDFGLAQFRGDNGLTMSGDLLGTLRYMSPEQATARRVIIDHRTDVYSLGVTLYELLTLRPAFEGRDRAEVLRRVAEEEPLPLRRLNPAVPIDLETIVQKAMAKDPADRYLTAQELADDLGRFAEDRPIRARRPSLLEHAARWSRRHTMAVAAGVAILVLGLLGLATATALIGQSRSEMVRQRNEARRQQALARRAVDEMYTQVAEQWLADQAALTPLQREFLEKALAFYQQFALAEGADLEARHEAVRALYRVAVIRKRLGRPTEAEAAVREVIRLGADLSHRAPDRPEYRLTMAEGRLLLARLLDENGHLPAGGSGTARDPDSSSPKAQSRMPAEAVREVIQAEGELRGLRTATPADLAYRRRLAQAYQSLCFDLTEAGHVPEAAAAVQEAMAIWEALVKESPAAVEDRFGLARTYSTRGTQRMWWGGRKNVEEAEPALRKADELLSKLHAERPADPRFRTALAGALTNLGVILQWTDRYAESERVQRRAVELKEALAADFPDVPEYQEDLAGNLDNLARVAFSKGRFDETAARSLEAAAVWERLAHRYTDRERYLNAYMLNSFSEADMRYHRGDAVGARRALEVIVPKARALAKASRGPNGVRLQTLSEGSGLLSEVAIQLGDAAAAERAAEEWAVAALDKVGPDKLGREVLDRSIMLLTLATRRKVVTPPRSLCSLAQIECSALKYRVLIAEARRRGFDDFRDLPVEDLPRLGTVVALLSTAPEGLRDPEYALRLADRVVAMQPRDKTGLPEGLRSMGWARYRMGDWKGCLDALEKSKDYARDGDFFAAMALWHLGEKDRARDVFDRADRWLAGYEKEFEERAKRGLFTYTPVAMAKRIRSEAADLLGVRRADDRAGTTAAADPARTGAPPGRIAAEDGPPAADDRRREFRYSNGVIRADADGTWVMKPDELEQRLRFRLVRRDRDAIELEWMIPEYATPGYSCLRIEKDRIQFGIQIDHFDDYRVMYTERPGYEGAWVYPQ